MSDDMTTPRPEALRLADDLAALGGDLPLTASIALRRLHAEVERLTAAQGEPTPREKRLRAAMERADRDGPLPGMISVFENSFGVAWTDPEWRHETSTWAQAWRAALASVPAAAQGEPVAWQERVKLTPTVWSGWYPCRHRSAAEPRSVVFGGVPYEWRPLYLAAPTPPKAEARPMTRDEATAVDFYRLNPSAALVDLNRRIDGKAEAQAVPEGLRRLAAFGAWAVGEFRCEIGDVDGASAQDAMEHLGVLHPVTVAEPCGEPCRCADYGEFPIDCFRLDPLVRSAMDALAAAPQAREGEQG